MKKFLLSMLAVAGMTFSATAETVTFVPEGSTYAGTATTTIPTGECIGTDYTAADITIQIEKVNNSNSQVSGGLLRWYQNDILHITPREGCTVTSVVIYAPASYANNKAAVITAANVDATAVTNAVEADGKFTWTGSATGAFSFSATKQVRFSALEVTYTGGAAPTVSAPKVSCDNNTVTITADGADAVYYTTNGTEPSNASTKYAAPFKITENTTVKAIAYKGTEKSLVTTYNAVYVGNYPDFASFVAANTTGTVDGPIYVLYQSADKRYLYLKDSKGGYMLSFGALTETYVNGDVLASITGKYSPYNNLPEMVPSEVGAKTSGAAIAPEELTAEELSVDMANTYIVLKGASISGVNGKNFSITDATGTVAGYNTVALAEIPEGENFTITGFVGRYKDNLQVTPVSIVGGTVIETVETPVFSVASGAVTAGTSVEITCATAGAVIFYTTDGSTPTAASEQYKAPIVINEAMTLNAIAVKEGMNDSKVASALYTIVDPNATVATFDFNKPAELVPAVTAPTEPSSGVDIDGTTFTSGVVSLAIAPAASETNRPRLWKLTGGDTEFRMYKGDSFTISVPAAEYKITAIDFTCATSNYNFGTETGTFTIDGKAAAWTCAETELISSVTFAAPADAKTSRVGAITVTYAKKENAVDSIVADDANAPVEYFNLQGVRVANPTPGALYIVRQGNKVSKTIVR